MVAGLFYLVHWVVISACRSFFPTVQREELNLRDSFRTDGNTLRLHCGFINVA